MTKYIFITGGVVSSLGKGIAAASIAVLLKSRGLKVNVQKFDPYLNIDPGTMNPTQHGEVFVTEDGCETDLDLGHYERFLGQNLYRSNNVTSGMIFWNVLSREREGDYLGNTVQIVPHITNEIKRRINLCLKKEYYDIIITEVGGTIGDIESAPFLEAIRQFERQNKSDCIHIHLTLVPFLKSSEEFKTKPTQYSVKQLREIGINADIIICRSENRFPDSQKEKIALFCDVEKEDVISAIDVKSIYDVPLNFEQENVGSIILKKLNIEKKEGLSLNDWKKYQEKRDRIEANPSNTNVVHILIVGKYTNLSDSYISIIESLKHASINNEVNPNILFHDSEKDPSCMIKFMKKTYGENIGILVPGGFGDRGIEGKIKAAKFARENNIPYLGLCLGMHIAVIEYARNVLGLHDANSSEFKLSQNNVIDLLPEQQRIYKKGGTMRLGAFPCKVKKETLLHSAYFHRVVSCLLNVDDLIISERHRHRYEFNNVFKDLFNDGNFIISGTSPDGNLVEVIELKNHPWFLACQFHPEFKSRPYKPHPLFLSFIKSIVRN